MGYEQNAEKVNFSGKIWTPRYPNQNISHSYKAHVNIELHHAYSYLITLFNTNTDSLIYNNEHTTIIVFTRSKHHYHYHLTP